MKSAPEEYRSPTPDELDELWREALIVFDASALLRISEFSIRTGRACLSAMRALESRLWLPNQASFELFKNSTSSRREVALARNKLHSFLLEIDVSVTSTLRSLKHPTLGDAFAGAWERSKEIIRAAMESADMPPEDLDAHFFALDSVLNSLYDGKIGEPLDNARIQQIYALGDDRYKSKVPPGFEDAKKSIPDKFGDLIFWFQILDQAKTRSKPIILVT